MLRAAVLCALFVALFTWSFSCGNDKYDIGAGGNAMPVKAIDDVLREHTKAIMSIPGVVGTGQGLYEGKPCIKVFVIKRTAALDQKIPDSLEGYPVVIEEIGEVKARPEK